ncbi:hypothetical protein [Xanthobacter autotrophicus]|uniref:hypothetical protein n=1 Tax=Xanthobacter autotrophicus TaxID=280 RepID=UPI003727172C
MSREKSDLAAALREWGYNDEIHDLQAFDAALERIAAGWPNRDIDALMSWNHQTD